MLRKILFFILIAGLTYLCHAQEKIRDFEDFKRRVEENEKRKYEQYEPELFSERLIDRAKNGDSRAQCDLGYRYLMGEGVGKDEVQGLNWLYISAQSGDRWAQLWYGTQIENNNGLTEPETCWRFLVYSASQDNMVALSLLKTLTSSQQSSLDSRRFPRIYKNGKYVQHEQNSGDTFLLEYHNDELGLKNKETKTWFKLYGVECPTVIKEYEDYFIKSCKCKPETLTKVASEAKNKVNKVLSESEFTIYTKLMPARPADVLHKTPFLSVIKYDNNKDLAEELLKEGLAILGGPYSNIQIPAGFQSPQNLQKAMELAKKQKKGLWEFYTEDK
jgi:endonuclease YncB( thermonuclease family)